MEFFNIKYLYALLLLIPIYFLIKKAYLKRAFGLDKLGLKREKSIYSYLYILAFFLVIISLLGPRILSEKEKVEIKGTDIYILVDVSKSMLAEDVLPNRITKGKEEIKNIIKGLNGDRIGFIPFAGDAYIQMPLTDDYDMANLYLDVIDTNLMSQGGTNFAKGIELAQKSFGTSSQGKNIILIISDGEDHSKDFSKINKDTYVYAIGVGTTKGSILKDGDQFIRDKDGKVVISKLEDKKLRELSKTGKYFESNNYINASEQFLRSINLLERRSSRQEEIRIYKELYQIPLFLGFLLFLICYFLEKRYKS